jgi:hypothetical protein
MTDMRRDGIMESNKPYKKTYKKGTTNSRNYGDTETKD